MQAMLVEMEVISEMLDLIWAMEILDELQVTLELLRYWRWRYFSRRRVC
jgi:hypothetical protein